MGRPSCLQKKPSVSHTASILYSETKGLKLCLTRYHSGFVIITRSSDTGFVGILPKPYILPAVTVGLRLHLLSPVTEIWDSRSKVSSDALFHCFTPASSSLNAKGTVLLLILAFLYIIVVKDIKNHFLCQA